ncbi:MAG: DUF922 domain-containing protein [Pseudomonadales bacterium]
MNCQFLKTERHRAPASTAAILLLVVSGAALAAPEINESFVFYDIKPVSKDDLANEINRRTPIREGGKRFKGHTRWRVQWKFKWKQQSNGDCHITDVKTVLDVTFTMPRITPGFSADTATQLEFKKYYASLFAHEKVHMKSGLHAANEIENVLAAFRKQGGCRNISAEANAKADAIVKKYNKRDKEFDIETNHGRKNIVGSSSAEPKDTSN